MPLRQLLRPPSRRCSRRRCRGGRRRTRPRRRWRPRWTLRRWLQPCPLVLTQGSTAAAQAEHRLNRTLASWRKVKCTILDELGFVPLSRDTAQLLFQFCADRYERGSLIITTNLDFARWTEVFGDAQMTAALLDRVTHRCHIIEHTGESYRFRESLHRKTTGTEV
ncbi:MAG: ATP-binding protein [Bacteroidota bacterium]